ncbi:MAG: peptidoglycan recognition family protein [Phycisphaerales bacterium]
MTVASLVGVVAWLQGCGGRTNLAKNFPQPLWPDKEPRIATISDPVAKNTTWYPPPPANGTPVPANVPDSSAVVPTAGVIARTNWTREQPRWKLSRPMNGVGMITVHHDALNASGMRGYGASVQRLNSVRRSHLDRGPTWVDIGYHYIIDPEGRIWEGRPISIEGAHVANTNDHNLGIMCMGNFNEHRPTQAQLNTLDGFVAAQMRAYRVPMSRVYTHRELGTTECPGTNLQNYMKQTRSSTGRLRKMA